VLVGFNSTFQKLRQSVALTNRVESLPIFGSEFEPDPLPYNARVVLVLSLRCAHPNQLFRSYEKIPAPKLRRFNNLEFREVP